MGKRLDQEMIDFNETIKKVLIKNTVGEDHILNFQGTGDTKADKKYIEEYLAKNKEHVTIFERITKNLQDSQHNIEIASKYLTHNFICTMIGLACVFSMVAFSHPIVKMFAGIGLIAAIIYGSYAKHQSDHYRNIFTNNMRSLQKEFFDTQQEAKINNTLKQY